MPGLTERLGQGARVLELACGAGHGLARLAATYPQIELVGVDGDAFSLEEARRRAAHEDVGHRVSLVQSTLEEFSADREFDLALINVSMHECRDIDRVAANVWKALKPGGHFVISDFPFPASLEGCRTVPARIMCGIQFFEAQIDDQLMPTAEFHELLVRHEFRDVDSLELTPVHSLIYGKR